MIVSMWVNDKIAQKQLMILSNHVYKALKYQVSKTYLIRIGKVLIGKAKDDPEPIYL